MKKRVSDNKKCFVCGTQNPAGLKLSFQDKPDGNGVETVFLPDERYQGWEGIVHGGIIATLLDETMAKAAIAAGLNVVTAEISVRFKKPAFVMTALTCAGEIETVQKKVVRAKATVFEQGGPPLATATSRMFVVD